MLSKKFVKALWLLALVAIPSRAFAQIPAGTWVKQSTPNMAGAMTLTVSDCCSGGARLVYTISGNQQILMTVDLRFRRQGMHQSWWPANQVA